MFEILNDPEPIEKECFSCKETKTLTDFSRDRNKTDGRTSNCKACITLRRNKEYNREYMRKKRERQNKAVKDVRNSSWRRNSPEKRMYLQAKNRARMRGIEFNIELEDIVIPDKCPILGTEFKLGTKGNYAYSYSLDRRETTKGYVKGNVWVISSKANTMKSDATKEELVLFAKNILKEFSDDDIV